MRSRSLDRPAFTLIELLVVIAIIAILIALLVPAVQKVRYAAARTQSTNNLKQLVLACQSYHGVWKYLPYNGAANNANATSNLSGSWGYQILPYVDQEPLYDSLNGNLPANWGTGLAVFMCPMRGRPGYVNGAMPSANQAIIPPGVTYTLTPVPGNVTDRGSATGSNGASVQWNFTGGGGSVSWSGNTIGNWNWIFQNGGIGFTFTNTSGVPLNVTIISGNNGTESAGGGSGPTTDYGINPWINSPNAGTVNAATTNPTLVKLADGTSNTILLGHIYFSPTEYQTTTSNGSTLSPFFMGGTLGTSRSSNGGTAATWLRDGPASSSNQWGSPMSEGGLMAMADGTVHVVPFTTPLTSYLNPNSGVVAPLD
jgi:prepilin-type N-terminal cleavage/methylation domain-containing protein